MSRYMLFNKLVYTKPTVQMPAVIVDLLILKCEPKYDIEPITKRYPCFNKSEKEFVNDCKD